MVAIDVNHITTDFNWVPKRPGEREGFGVVNNMRIDSCIMGLIFVMPWQHHRILRGALEVIVDGVPVLGKWVSATHTVRLIGEDLVSGWTIHTIEPHSQADHYDAHKLLCSGKNVEIRALA